MIRSIKSVLLRLLPSGPDLIQEFSISRVPRQNCEYTAAFEFLQLFPMKHLHLVDLSLQNYKVMCQTFLS